MGARYGGMKRDKIRDKNGVGAGSKWRNLWQTHRSRSRWASPMFGSCRPGWTTTAKLSLRLKVRKTARAVANVASGLRSCMGRMSGSPSDTYRYLAGRVFCAIDPSGINVRNVRVSRPRRKAWNGMIPTVRTVLHWITISCCSWWTRPWKMWRSRKGSAMRVWRVPWNDELQRAPTGVGWAKSKSWAWMKLPWKRGIGITSLW